MGNSLGDSLEIKVLGSHLRTGNAFEQGKEIMKPRKLIWMWFIGDTVRDTGGRVTRSLIYFQENRIGSILERWRWKWKDEMKGEFQKQSQQDFATNCVC